MQVTVERNNLLKALEYIDGVVEKRHAIPILANIKIEAANNNFITLTATDLDLAITAQVPAQVGEQGISTIPARSFFEITRRLADGAKISLKIDQSVDADIVTIEAGEAKFTLPTMNADEFPDFDAANTPYSFVINADIFKMLFIKTRHAIANEEARYYLNGVFFHATENNGIPVLRAVATDGHRLARADVAIPAGASDIPEIIVPKKTVHELIKLLEDAVGDVNVSLSTNRLVITLGDFKLSSKLIEGKYPDYLQVLPVNNDKFLEVSPRELARSIDLVISVTPDKTRSVKLNLSENGVTIASSSEMNHSSTGVQKIEGKYNNPTALSVGFNAKYILDSLSAIDGDVVQFSFSSSMGAVLARDLTDPNSEFLLMPLQIA
jgi:DNA polymerase-3 subunit beta